MTLPAKENNVEFNSSTITNYVNDDNLIVNPNWYNQSSELHGSIDNGDEDNSIIHNLQKTPNNKHTKFE